MFTGIIQEKSQVISRGSDLQGFEVTLKRPLNFLDLKIGESIAVDGVCLSLTKFDLNSLTFFVGKETLLKSNFVKLQKGHLANLERSLAFGDRLGGHMVSGHVDGTGEVVESVGDGDCLSLKIKISPIEFKSIITKGSVTLNGVSLTVNAMNREEKTIEVYLIPETLLRTNLGELQVSDLINVECDQFVKIIAQQVNNYMKEQNA